jgi:pullulanase/glycogen debranching enzyme
MTDHKTEKRLKEDVRFEIISKTITDPDWTAERAAEVLHLTVRQVFRLKAKVQARGRDGLIHGNTGQKPVSTLSERLHQRVVDLYDREYRNCEFNYSQLTDVLVLFSGTQNTI